ncbi:cupin domain-containing protein [Alteribacillus iranensis]|uniref:Gentisate 1,2-dioxygenase n=1 Tax=Alteribacillus iranensis TaxID=930128 RepID=A0A1I2BFI1_9BACI|nr:cupin domain-containing protein [Alteribacillus iranensis]SFE54819.1 gentisate 1,2-dioxygenase [Alteribacillus iranensis]
MSVNPGKILPYVDYVEAMRKPLLSPAMWKWDDIENQLYSSDSDRRHLVTLGHPELEEEASAVHDLAIVIQVIKPGEKSNLHRHGPWAIHFVVRGEGYTAINDEKYHWGFGDTVLTPAWTYHEHVNTSETEDAILYTFQNSPALSRSNNLFREEPAGLPPKHVLQKDDPNQSFQPEPPVTANNDVTNWK